MSLAIVIMAAGRGTRLKSQRLRCCTVGGKPLLAHVIAAASQIVSPADIFVVVGHQAEKVEAAVAETGVKFVLQAEQLEHGNITIQCAREAIAGYDVLVLSGDVPLIQTQTLERIWGFHKEENAAMTILTAVPEDPYGYGRVIRKGDGGAEVQAIVEQKSLAPGQEAVGEINSGIYAFRVATLLEHLDQLTAANSAGEYYLTDMARILVAAGERVVALKADEAVEVQNPIPSLSWWRWMLFCGAKLHRS